MREQKVYFQTAPDQGNLCTMQVKSNGRKNKDIFLTLPKSNLDILYCAIAIQKFIIEKHCCNILFTPHTAKN